MRHDGDREGGPFPDAAEEPREAERVAEDQHRDEHAEPDHHVQLSVVHRQHVRAKEESPTDPQSDPGQERESDVAEVELEAILPERRLERRVGEPQAESCEALPHGSPLRLPCCRDAVDHRGRRVLLVRPPDDYRCKAVLSVGAGCGRAATKRGPLCAGTFADRVPGSARHSRGTAAGPPCAGGDRLRQRLGPIKRGASIVASDSETELSVGRSPRCGVHPFKDGKAPACRDSRLPG